MGQTYCCTTCVTEAELFVIFELPLNVTVTTLEPKGSDDVVNVALPPLS